MILFYFAMNWIFVIMKPVTIIKHYNNKNNYYNNMFLYINITNIS